MRFPSAPGARPTRRSEPVAAPAAGPPEPPSSAGVAWVPGVAAPPAMRFSVRRASVPSAGEALASTRISVRALWRPAATARAMAIPPAVRAPAFLARAVAEPAVSVPVRATAIRSTATRFAAGFPDSPRAAVRRGTPSIPHEPAATPASPRSGAHRVAGYKKPRQIPFGKEEKTRRGEASASDNALPDCHPAAEMAKPGFALGRWPSARFAAPPAFGAGSNGCADGRIAGDPSQAVPMPGQPPVGAAFLPRAAIIGMGAKRFDVLDYSCGKVGRALVQAFANELAQLEFDFSRRERSRRRRPGVHGCSFSVYSVKTSRKPPP